MSVGVTVKLRVSCRNTRTAEIQYDNGNVMIYLSHHLTNLMHKICFTISFISRLYMFRAHALIIRQSKLLYTASHYISLYLTISHYLTNLMNKICFTVKFYFMVLHVSSTCAHHQEVKIALHSLWYHHTYRCDDTKGCVMQF